MGQARQKNERLIATLKEEMKKWTQPYTAREEAVADELRGLPVERVGRPSLEQLSWAGMQPRYCHLNAVWMEENDPDRETRAVLGWAVIPGGYVLHSVIRQRGKLICVTPPESGPRDWIDFIADPKLVRTKTEAGQYVFHRDGHEMGFGVRSDPQFLQQFWEFVSGNIAAGKPAHQIMKESGDYAAAHWKPDEEAK